MAIRLSSWLPILALALILYARPAHAFGAGNIGSTSKIEGQNWRHGDIEDTLLTLLSARAFGGKKFTKLDVKRTYFGNWLRDYSQAVDVGTVKYVSAEAIRLLLWVLGFMSFGLGTGEFEVTRDRLGCYRPEEHIDNPRHYADDLDARQYDRRLRGPVDERRELSIDERTGLKHYIASEDQGITTSAGLVRRLFSESIELGRRYKHSRDDRDFFEALRLLGTACHCLEDYSAHSNYTELALIEMGEREVFPHVGRRTQVELRGARNPVYPCVTGTFGGVDFLHSVMGEFSDKTTQSELQELEGTIQQSQNADTSLLQDLLDKLPPGILGDSDHKGKADQLQANSQAAQMQNLNISPKEPEEVTRQVNEISKQIYPILEFHDNIVKSISEAVEKIPVLPDLIEQIQNQVSLFVFSLLAPFMVPIIQQVKNELRTGSSEIIQSSREQQHVVFNDDRSTDPTHSMLSKDHFSNVLNEPAGKIASQVLKWVVPQIVACWDDDSINIQRTTDRIIAGVFHHPALRQHGEDGARDGRMLMFEVVERWWSGLDDRERDDLRDKLSREGVEQGRNHKEGVHDSGHGCGKPLGLPTMGTSQSSGAIGGVVNALGGGSGGNSHVQSKISDTVGEAVGGGALGSIVGGLAGAVGGGILGGAFSGKGDETETHQSSGYGEDGSYNSRITQTGRHSGGYGGEGRYGQAQVSHTEYPGGGHRDEYRRYEQDERHGETSGYGFQQRTEVRHTSGGGYEQRTERRYESGSHYESEVQEQRVTSSGRRYTREESHSGRRDEYEQQPSYAGDSFGGGGYGQRQEYGERREEYGGRQQYGERREDRDERQQYGERREEYGDSSGYGGEESYGRREQREEYGGGGYGQEESQGRSHRRDEYDGGYERREAGEDEHQRRDDDMPGGFGGSSEGYGESGGYQQRRW